LDEKQGLIAYSRAKQKIKFNFHRAMAGC